MTYKEFVAELIERFGEERGVLMALRAEVGFLRRHLEEHGGEHFTQAESKNFTDFLNRHPKE